MCIATTQNTKKCGLYGKKVVKRFPNGRARQDKTGQNMTRLSIMLMKETVVSLFSLRAGSPFGSTSHILLDVGVSLCVALGSFQGCL